MTDSPPSAAADAAASPPNPPADADGPASSADTRAQPLNLTDFVDLASLQDVQDGFTALTRLAMTIRDAQGRELTQPTDAHERSRSDRVLDFLLTDDELAGADGVLDAPIVVDGQAVGRIEVHPRLATSPSAAPPARLRELAASLGLDAPQIEQLQTAAEADLLPPRAAAMQFLYLLANHITRLCYQGYQLRQRVDELSALYDFATLLSGRRDLQQVLDSAAQDAAELLDAAVVIRLLDPDSRELAVAATHGIAPSFAQDAFPTAGRSPTYARALAGEAAALSDLRQDPRAVDANRAADDGFVGLMVAGMIYQGQPIGTIDWLVRARRAFSQPERQLAQAIARLLTAAVVNARAQEDQHEQQRVQRQLRIASQVQQKMLLTALPRVPGFDIAAHYVASFELGGDFYDLIDLRGNVGIAIGDVVGKGVAAGLLMASVRAAIRAYAQDVYDLDEIITRVNASLAADTRDDEFATLFYGVLDPARRRLTYCNAGHEPGLLLRDDKVTPLMADGMLLGVDPTQRYTKHILDLRPGDRVLLYTDGLIDAMNAAGRKFGRGRMLQAFAQTADLTAADTVHHMLWAMRRHLGLTRNTDDTTLVVIHHPADSHPSRPL
jgi:phosphoserine phosphatase RsbU/P